MEPALLVGRPRPGVALVTFNRPDRLNALGTDMFEELRQVIPALNVDPEVKAIVLTGAGRGFCAGHDLNEIEKLNRAPRSLGEQALRLDDEIEVLMRLRTISTPVIAAVNGAATGGGMSIALACDIRIASTSAKFGVAFINIDISSGDAGLSWTLPRLVGPGMAAELMFTGRRVEAEEAERIRLVNRVVAPDRLIDEALDMAEDIAAHDMLALWMTKRTLNASGNMALGDAIAMETTAQVIAMDSEAARRKTAEFLARRSAKRSS